jgi:hypothetical protein
MPNDSGLPQLPAGVATFSSLALLAVDVVSIDSGAQSPQWGIFNSDGDAVVLADNVVSMGFSQDYLVSDYPQEVGAFASYNKSAKPNVTKLQFSTGGSVDDRQQFLDSIAAIAGDAKLYTVVTPEANYSSSNVTHYSYDRNQSNAGLLKVDVFLKQIAVSGAATFSNTKSPTDAAQVNGGLVQPGQVTRGPDLPNISGPLAFQ